jgi:hypothetical protein
MPTSLEKDLNKNLFIKTFFGYHALIYEVILNFKKHFLGYKNKYI